MSLWTLDKKPHFSSPLRVLCIVTVQLFILSSRSLTSAWKCAKRLSRGEEKPELISNSLPSECGCPLENVHDRDRYFFSLLSSTSCSFSRALARMGNVYFKQKKWAEAIKYYDKSVTEHRNPDVVSKKTQVLVCVCTHVYICVCVHACVYLCVCSVLAFVHVGTIRICVLHRTLLFLATPEPWLPNVTSLCIKVIADDGL